MTEESPPRLSLAQIAGYFLRLGTLGFGGPIALAGAMQRDLVERRGWITQEEYLEGLAVAQTLPGPLAAQLAMWLGYVRRGFWGAVAAAIPFILPPYIIVSVVAALYVAFAGSNFIQALFYGVGPTVIALILRGAWKLLGVTVKSDGRLWAIFAFVAVITFVIRTEVAILFVLSGLLGVLLYAPPAWLRLRTMPALLPLGFINLLAATQSTDLNTLVALGVFFFKAGAFTFGSGLAIVPFLQQGVVHEFGWLTEREFLDAVAMGMITPGPVVITAVFVGSRRRSRRRDNRSGRRVPPAVPDGRALGALDHAVPQAPRSAGIHQGRNLGRRRSDRRRGRGHRDAGPRGRAHRVDLRHRLRDPLAVQGPGAAPRRRISARGPCSVQPALANGHRPRSSLGRPCRGRSSTDTFVSFAK